MAEKTKEKKQHTRSLRGDPSGITKRWVRSTLTVILVVYVIMAALLFFMFRSYYYGAVEQKLNAQYNSSVSNFFSGSRMGDRSFEETAQEYIRTFDQKDKIEVWIIDENGTVIENSSGFPISTPYMPDYKAALKSSSHSATYTGANELGEPIKSATFLINTGDSNRCAVRYIISLREVNQQLGLILLILLLLMAILGSLVVISGLYFLDTIAKPIDEINDVTRRIAEGDMDARTKPQKYHDEIGELAHSVNVMAEEVGSTDKMKNDFISTVSHEMKTPLTAIKGWAETLLSMGDSDANLTKRGLEVIVEETGRLTGVVNDLLDLSKIANGRMSLKYEKIDYLAELDQTIYMFKDRSFREGIELNYNATTVPAPAAGDPDRIDQVFVNILDNAFKYTKQGGKITVLAEVIPPQEGEERATVQIFVEDTGCGIAAEELPKIRRKFYKSNISVSGSGIGLAVVDEIVKMHNGTMDIQSELGVGTCVILKFPVDYVKTENPVLSDEVQEAMDHQEEQL